MKKLAMTLFCSAFLMEVASAQQTPLRGVLTTQEESGSEAQPQKFDLDFPGGSPKALVAAIEEATGHRLNAIVPTEYESLQMPPIKVSGVTVQSLFEALFSVNRGIVVRTNGWFISDFGFVTKGPPGTNAVWYFAGNRGQEQPTQKFCRFYQLADYLADYKVEDITTAIQTGWQLLGVKSPPELKFHPETKLLIAVGPADELGTIESVLQQLRKAPRSPAPASGGQPPKKDGA